MEVRLSPEHEALVAEDIASGRYSSPEEFFADAIDTLRQRDAWGAEELAKLDASIAEAERGELMDEDEVRRRLDLMRAGRIARQTA